LLLLPQSESNIMLVVGLRLISCLLPLLLLLLLALALVLLCCSALSVDSRNFHAWNYRQFIVKLMGLPTEGELTYSTSLIAGEEE